MKDQTKLKIVDANTQNKPIISIVSFKFKHLSRLHEAALRERSKIHSECDVLEQELKALEKKYAKTLRNLRSVQIEVDRLEHSILMENIKK